MSVDAPKLAGGQLSTVVWFAQPPAAGPGRPVGGGGAARARVAWGSGMGDRERAVTGGEWGS